MAQLNDLTEKFYFFFSFSVLDPMADYSNFDMVSDAMLQNVFRLTTTNLQFGNIDCGS